MELSIVFLVNLLFMSNLFIPSFCSLHLINSSFSSPKNIGFSARLIHHSSPESPFYDPNATRVDLLKASKRSSSARSNYFAWLMAKMNSSFSSSSIFIKSAITPVVFSDGEFAMKFSIGTPPVDTFAVPDTGSSLTWLQCLPCITCYDQARVPIFDPAKSSSYQAVQCWSQECNNTVDTRSCRNSPDPKICKYAVQYNDNSSTEGDVAFEKFTFREGLHPDKDHVLWNMIFGCGHINFETEKSLPGIMGLSNESSSFLQQLGFSTFSYCLSSNVSSDHSVIRFGLENKDIPGYSTTALSPSKVGWYFFKNVDGLYVDGEKLNIPDWIFQFAEAGLGGLMIDSGTSYTQLYNLALAELVKVLKEKIGLTAEEDKSESDQPFALCYDYDEFEEVSLPDVTLRFSDNNRASYSLTNDNLWVVNGLDQKCLAMMNVSGASILGTYQQRDVHFVYDLWGDRVLFKEYDNCNPLPQ